MDMSNIKVGDVVIRMLAGISPMKLKVSDIDKNFIYCGPWMFDINTGNEFDEYLGISASHLILD